jgi:hypothetical protein
MEDPFSDTEVALIEAAASRGEETPPATVLRLVARLRVHRAEALRLADSARCPYDCSMCRDGEDEES